MLRAALYRNIAYFSKYNKVNYAITRGLKLQRRPEITIDPNINPKQYYDEL